MLQGALRGCGQSIPRFYCKTSADTAAERAETNCRGTGGDELMIEERDISVAMRDGTRLAVDVYRPDTPGKYPVLYASALHNKDIQGPDIADILPPQPAHAPLWFGPIEAGDTRRFVANGYIHVIAQPRGSAKSEGHYGHEDIDH